MKTKFKPLIILFTIICCLSSHSFLLQAKADDSRWNSNTKIHFLSLRSHGDAILLESNGKFAMIDSGEDNDYPDGSNPRYPLRNGTVIGNGCEEQVISYLKKQGVTADNFMFYIGTHAHSDHIGSAASVIKEFHPQRVYLLKYDDSYIQTDDALWDNQYIYDKTILAAYETGAKLIQTFNTKYTADTYAAANEAATQDVSTYAASQARISDAYYDPSTSTDYRDPESVYRGEPLLTPYSDDLTSDDTLDFSHLEDAQNSAITGSPYLTLGDMSLELLNYDRDWRRYPANDANEMSLCVKLTAFDHQIFLGGDLPVAEEKSIASRIGKVDVMKLSHHGYSSSNSPEFMQTLSPSIVIQPGDYQNIPSFRLNEFDTLFTKLKTQIYATTWYTDSYQALIVDLKDLDTNIPQDELVLTTTSSKEKIFFQNGYKYRTTGFVPFENRTYLLVDSPYPITNQWYHFNNRWYFSDTDSALVKGWIFYDQNVYYTNDRFERISGLLSDNKNNYYFNPYGVLIAKSWCCIDGKWYYFNTSDEYQTGWLAVQGSWYYLNRQGIMQTGWQYLNGTWYYLKSSGAMATGWQYINGTWYFMDASGSMHTGWLLLGNTWYFMNQSGQMLTGWQLINGTWYYFYANGAMSA